MYFKKTMTSNSIRPFILSSPQHDHKHFYPIPSRINPSSSKFSSKLLANPRVGKIYNMEHVPDDDGEKLKPLWDDGHGTQTAKDYLQAAMDMSIHPDAGPPRWFCPTEAGPPLKNSPVLLYLPGVDGVGMGLIAHHKALGKVFEVRCLHIPVHDQTSYEELVKFVENAVKLEHDSSPNKPIYLVGDSFGGCLALSVAASNPMIDLVLILVNPATSFNESKLQPVIPFLESFREELHYILPYIFGITLGDPIKIAKLNNTQNQLLSPVKQLKKLLLDLSSLVTGVRCLADTLPKKTFLRKLKLIRSGAAFTKSRLHAVEAEVLILASEKDNLLPSKLEAQKLERVIKKCKVRFFKESGHVLLMEDEINLLSIIKGTSMYRRSKRRDIIKDFIPPSMSEFQYIFDQKLGLFRIATSPVMLSTLENGKIVRGLKGVPDDGPILLVGYHMLFGFEIGTVVEEFLREKNIMVHGAAHPLIFTEKLEPPFPDSSEFDLFRVLGAVPVTSHNLFKLLSRKSFVLLYPGGVRESMHGKHDAYKLFWPQDPEFVRMAARFGAKIVPFGVVGEDDLLSMVLDVNDIMNIPFARDIVKKRNENIIDVMRVREQDQEVSNHEFLVPFFYPKVPGRFYFLFGKPVETKGREELIKDKTLAKEFYHKIKSDVEQSMEYLIKKREEDPHRNLFDRILYRVLRAPIDQVPSFDP